MHTQSIKLYLKCYSLESSSLGAESEYMESIIVAYFFNTKNRLSFKVGPRVMQVHGCRFPKSKQLISLGPFITIHEHTLNTTKNCKGQTNPTLLLEVKNQHSIVSTSEPVHLEERIQTALSIMLYTSIKIIS